MNSDSTVRRCAGRLGSLALGLALASPGIGQADAGSSQEWLHRLEQNRPWQAYRLVPGDPGHRQIYAQLAVFLGDEQPGCSMFPTRLPPILADAEHRDALDTIAAAARDARVVMLNESHFRRTFRTFLMQLIERLDDLGFDALAAETFAPGIAASMADGVPRADAGFYLADPAYAAAVRRAAALGWDFVPYEGVHPDPAEREAAQARALADWLEHNPGRRLLVYAGGSHISEDPEQQWMAARFRKLTGIDPLTVSQVAACPGGDDTWPFAADRSVVAFRDGTPLSPPHYDMAVLHPPGAVAALEELRGSLVEVCLPPVAQDSLLRAFAHGDPPEAIARDQVVVPAGARSAKLRLAPGRYALARESASALEPLGVVELDGTPRDDCLLR